MPASSTVLPRELVAFPSWLDLPPDYTVNDWILWQKGKLIAARLRENPALVKKALERLQNQPGGRFQASDEWLELLQNKGTTELAFILESPEHEGQRLRSSSPFVREPFIQPEEIEAIRERAYLG